MNALTIDERLVRELSGSAKLVALLRAHGYSYQRFAQDYGFWPTQVKLCVYGARPYPAVRDALAKVLELPREELDHLLNDPKAPEEAPDTAVSRAQC